MAEKHSGFEATGEVDMGTHKITNVVDPTANQEAATKKYHDDNKYTDAEAVAAADTSDKFVERNVENAVTVTTALKKNTTGGVLDLSVETSGFTLGGSPLTLKGKHLTKTYQNILASLYFPDVELTGTDQSVVIGRFQFYKGGGNLNSMIKIYIKDNAGNAIRPLDIHYNKIDVRVNLFLTSIKSGATQAASGASANEVWKTASHASLPDNVLMIGV